MYRTSVFRVNYVLDDKAPQTSVQMSLLSEIKSWDKKMNDHTVWWADSSMNLEILKSFWTDWVIFSELSHSYECYIQCYGDIVCVLGFAILTNSLDLDSRVVSNSWVWQYLTLCVMEVCSSNMHIAYIARECWNQSIFDDINTEITLLYLIPKWFLALKVWTKLKTFLFRSVWYKNICQNKWWCNYIYLFKNNMLFQNNWFRINKMYAESVNVADLLCTLH